MDLLFKLLFLCPALFAAGLIDGIAGGGGIISLPAFIMTGIPLNCAYGCNKLQSCLGTSASLLKYAKSARHALFHGYCGHCAFCAFIVSHFFVYYNTFMVANVNTV